MSRLLGRAAVKRLDAEADYRRIAEDDFNLDACCYNLQQCVEMTLKYIISIYGERYIENHDLRAQLNKLNNMGISVPCEARLREMAATINEWEAQSRYMDSFSAAIGDVDEVRQIADTLLEYARGLVKEIEIRQEFPQERLKP